MDNSNIHQQGDCWEDKAWNLLSKVRQQSPLIQCITNFVSMDIVANTLLSAGASPAMIHAVDEICEFTPVVHALCINVGTLTPEWLPAMKSAAALAAKLGKPWVLDPVAAAASSFRLKACLDLIELKPTVIRGNGSEIIALSNASVGHSKKKTISYRSSGFFLFLGEWVSMIMLLQPAFSCIIIQGVDSLHTSTDALEAAKSLAQASGSVVAVSGAVDLITDGDRFVGAHNGVPMMQLITATGCSVTALISAFVAVDPSHAFEAAASALSIFGIAGEMGMNLAKGPASLRVHLIDSLYNLNEATVKDRVKITSLP